MTETLRYPYQFSRARLLSIPAVATGLTVALSYVASHHDRFKDYVGALAWLAYHHPGGVWVLAAGGAAATCIAFVHTLSHWSGQIITLADSSVTLPRASISGGLVSIPYAAIKSVRQHAIRGYQAITVTSERGRASVFSFGFRSARAFDEFHATLKQRIGKSPSPQAPKLQAASGAHPPRQARGRVVMFEDLMWPDRPARRYGKRKDSVMDDRERAFDRLLQSCFSYVGLQPWDIWPLYIVNLDEYVLDDARTDGLEIVLTKRGVEFHDHHFDPGVGREEGSHQVKRFDDVNTFLRFYVSEWIEQTTQRDLFKTRVWALREAQANGTFPEFFRRLQMEREKLEQPMRSRLDTFLAGPECSTASLVVDRQ
jgi:hypothetical protein